MLLYIEIASENVCPRKNTSERAQQEKTNVQAKTFCTPFNLILCRKGSKNIPRQLTFVEKRQSDLVQMVIPWC